MSDIGAGCSPLSTVHLIRPRIGGHHSQHRQRPAPLREEAAAPFPERETPMTNRINNRSIYIYTREDKAIARRHRNGHNQTYKAATPGDMEGRYMSHLLNEGWTQKEIAAEIGRSQMYISRRVKRIENEIEGEIWKDHPTYDGLSVSDHGRVRRNGRILNQHADPRGYKNVTLHMGRTEEGKQICKCLTVHRLVAEAHIQADIKGLDIHHVNGLSNHASNLQPMTPEAHRALHQGEREAQCIGCDPDNGKEGTLCTACNLNQAVLDFEFGKDAA